MGGAGLSKMFKKMNNDGEKGAAIFFLLCSLFGGCALKRKKGNSMREVGERIRAS